MTSRDVRRWIVRRAASGETLGTVEATSWEEAFAKAIALAEKAGLEPQRLDVRLEEGEGVPDA